MAASRPGTWVREQRLRSICAALALSSASLGQAEPPLAPRLDASFGKLPLYFVENKGQLDPRVAYAVQGREATAYFTAQGLTLALARPGIEKQPVRDQYTRGPTGLSRAAVAIDFVDGRRAVKLEGRGKTEAVVSYFKGRRDAWLTGLATYASIAYRDVWRGIDVEWTGKAGLMESTFVVRPGADPRRIRLRYRGARALQINAAGELEVVTAAGVFREQAPLAYQDLDGQREAVAAEFVVRREGADPVVTFRLGSYDRRRALWIDPVLLVYCGYIGGIAGDLGNDIAVDAAGAAYVTGETYAAEATFPAVGGPDSTYNGRGDVFIAKVRADGTGLVYAGYIGGDERDFGDGIAVDAAGSVYLSGGTASSEATFPTVVGPDLTHNGGTFDAFVAKLTPDGRSLVYCGYIGGSDGDSARGIAVDVAGGAYLTGWTLSNETTFPVAMGPDLTYNSTGIAEFVDGDAFVAKLRPDGTGLEYAGYIGGADFETAADIALDAGGNAYVTGVTMSEEATFPVVGGPDLTYNGTMTLSGIGDAFVAKVRADGTGLVYSGYIGGAYEDGGWSIAVDGDGHAYVSGQTSSSEATFPATTGPDLTANGAGDAFVTKVDADGAGLVYAGFIGGGGLEWPASVALDAAGNAYVAGATESDETTFPVAMGPDLTWNGGIDGHVAMVRADGTGLVSAGYIGGGGTDIIDDVALDAGGSIYVTGYTYSSEATFPVLVGPDLSIGTGSSDTDAFVAMLGTASCFAGASQIQDLLAYREPSALADIRFSWLPDPAAAGYNLWYVTRKEDIPLARQSSSPPAIPVSGCAVPTPVLGLTCADVGALTRDPSLPFFYQVRAYCDAVTEGP